MAKLQIEEYQAGPLGTNCYFLINDETKETVITDPGGSVEMLDDAIREIPDFPKKLASELKHCIVAHHGELEYGSPKKPALAEAMALNCADNADAKMQTLTEIFKAKDTKDWLGYNRLFESNLRKTSI